MTSLPPLGPEGTSAAGPTPGSQASAAARTAAVVLIALEASALLGIAVWWVSGAIRGGGLGGSEVFLAAFALGVAAVLVAAARVLAQGRRGARGPIVTWQVLQAATASTVLGVPVARAWAAAALGVAAAVVLLVLAPGAAAIRSGPSGPPERA